jgi:hydrogenase nickel incorporation protein HypA/HybF
LIVQQNRIDSFAETESMHELSIAHNVLEIVQQYVPMNQQEDVRTVRMMVGELSGVVADSLAFCFQAITAGTPLERAVLEIEHIPLRARCRQCENLSTIEQTRFQCPACGSTDVEITSGRELQVREIELANERK